MFMDISSEMIHALLPIYLVTVMGTSALVVGVIEGTAEAIASIVKVFSGALSDWLGRRKVLAVVGYGLAALTKPVFPLAPAVEWLVAARFVDRLGKGIRGAPRDALIADISPPRLRGASYGLRQSLDTVGAFIGPLLAILLMWGFQGSFQLVFWCAVVPAFLAVGLLVVGVKDPERSTVAARVAMPLRCSELRKLSSLYWWTVSVGTVFTLARFSEAFLVLRAQEVGLAIMWVPLVLVAMNLVFAGAAYPAGALSDRIGRNRLLGWGMGLLVAADVALAWLPGLPGLALGIALWGLHMAFAQGILLSLVADAAPATLRGTAFGIFNLITGVSTLAASVMAGVLWDRFGSTVTFAAGASFAAASLVTLRFVQFKQA